VIVESPQAMREAGRAFAGGLKPGHMVALSGGLGAGKTLFCKGVLEAFGYTGDVPSPTYNIVHHYAPPDVTLAIIHADLYRLDNPDELDELGLDEDDAIRLVEWAEQGGRAMETADYRVRIDILDETRRAVMIEGCNDH
jgi:tRNA threonylcarbamoyladenosine biosynthesis protein TsaE